jgi:hypothetical protein
MRGGVEEVERGADVGGTDASAGVEQHRPYSGHARLGGDGLHQHAARHRRCPCRWAKPQPDDVTGHDPLAPMPLGGLCLDLMVCSPVPSMPGSTAWGDAVPTLKPLGVADLGVTELGLPRNPDLLSPPTSRRQVGNSVEQACSRVTATDRLLREAIAMVGRDILHLI